MKISFAILLFALSPVLRAESPEALVDRLISAPGDFDQMCDSPPPLDPRIPLPIYQMVADRDVHLTMENIAELRKQRDQVVPVLVKRLAAFDFTKPPKPVIAKRKFKEDTVEVSGINPRQLSGLVYEMLLGLDAVEALPALLKIEEQLRTLLAKADADPKSPVPTIYLDGYITMPTGKDALAKRDQAMSRGRVVQRELLSVMLQLLRAQQFQPVVDSDLEKAYGVAVKARAQEDDLKDIKTPEDLKAKNDEWTKFDPIQKVPIPHYLDKPPTVPFNADLRNSIRGYTEQFIKTVPKEQWKLSWAK